MSAAELGSDNSLELDYSALIIPARSDAVSARTGSQQATAPPAQGGAEGQPAGSSRDIAAFKSTRSLQPSSPEKLPNMQRTVHMSAVITLVLALPSALYSLICLATAGNMLALGIRGLGFLTWLFPLLWIIAGVLLFYPPVERVFVRSFMDVRKPTASELRTLQPLWERVTGSAGVDPGTFMLGVQDSPELNASAAAGHSVAVTAGALENLEPRHLEAVLAHELGHHLGGHPVAALWNYWIALPGRFFNSLVRRLYGFFNSIIRLFSFRGWLCSVAFVAIMGVAVLLSAPWLLMVLLVPVGLAAASRASELAADKIAVQLGYGPSMVEVLEIFDSLETEPAGGPGRRFAGWMATHPSAGNRIHRIGRLLLEDGS